MMKKVGLFIIGLIALMVVLANVGPLISLAICAVILYFTFRQFMKSESKGVKDCLGNYFYRYADGDCFTFSCDNRASSSLYFVSCL